jgi:energy-coupling factor transporter ATP-binding protein EcfA2
MRFALLPVLTFVVSLSTLQALKRLAPVESWGQPVALAMALVAVAYMHFVSESTISTRIDHIFASLRRRIVVGCTHAGDPAFHHVQVSCLFTPEHLRAPVFEYTTQNEVVKKLARACVTSQPGEFWFVDGPSGSGKTRAALLLVAALIRDPKCEFSDRFYMYDFSASLSTQRNFLRVLGSKRLDDGVVIVDNFQLVAPSVIRELTRRLLSEPAKPYTRLIIFLCQPCETWNLSPGTDVRLLTEAKSRAHYLILPGCPSEPIARALHDVDPTASDLLNNLGTPNVASAAQLHFAQAMVRHRRTPMEILQAIRLMHGHIVDEPSERLLRVLALIAALSMHRGFFNLRDYRRAARAGTPHMRESQRIGEMLRMLLLLRRLRRIGVVPKVHLGGSHYVFHEAIAELLITRLWPSPSFKDTFITAGHYRLENLGVEQGRASYWLVATEIGDQVRMRDTFDSAMQSGAYAQMAEVIRRGADRYELSSAGRLQLAILLDRVGQFANARLQLSAATRANLDPADEMVVQYVLAHAESCHDEEATSDLVTLREHADRLVSLAARYWEIHIAAHQGTFAPDELEGLARPASRLASGSKAYWALYTAARMHFDLLRQRYLSGTASLESIATADRGSSQLLRVVPIYDAFRLLYVQAHFVGHFLLPRFAMFHVPPNEAEIEHVETRAGELRTLDDLLTTAQRLYSRARDEFSQYGDREAQYLRADIMNCGLMNAGAGLSTVENDLYDYAEFIQKTGFSDIASYPHLYFFRWHILSYYQALLEGHASAVRTADEHLSEARRHLRHVIELDRACGNKYGLFRAEVLSALVDGIRRAFSSRPLKRLAEDATEAGYNFESKLLHHLMTRVSVTGEELRTILRFYPFVHQ